MKVTELKAWKTLTPQEQARLKEIYNVDKKGNLPESMTKSMGQPAPEGVEKGGDNA